MGTASNRNGNDFDPRGKLLVLLVGWITCFRVAPLSAAAGAMGLLILGVVLWRRVDMRRFGKTLSLALLMVMIATLPWLFSSGSGMRITGMELTGPTRDAAMYYLQINLRAVLLYALLLALVQETPFVQWIAALKFFRVPAIMITVLYLSYRLIDVLRVDIYQKYLAFQSRFIQLPLGLRWRYRLYLIRTFLEQTFNRQDQLYLAMISRAFEGRIHIWSSLCWRQRDGLFVGLNLLVLGGIWLWH